MIAVLQRARIAKGGPVPRARGIRIVNLVMAPARRMAGPASH